MENEVTKPDVSATSISNRITVLTRLYRMTKIELAAKVGISVKTMQNWGRVYPSIENLYKIAEFFGVTVDYLVTGIGEIKVDDQKLEPMFDDFNNLSETNKELVRQLVRQLSRLK